MVLYSREGRRVRCIKRDLSYYDKAKKDPLITVFTKALWKLYNTSKMEYYNYPDFMFSSKKHVIFVCSMIVNGMQRRENVISLFSYIISNDSKDRSRSKIRIYKLSKYSSLLFQFSFLLLIFHTRWNVLNV